jgi:hypothetical protein
LLSTFIDFRQHAEKFQNLDDEQLADMDDNYEATAARSPSLDADLYLEQNLKNDWKKVHANNAM